MDSSSPPSLSSIRSSSAAEKKRDNQGRPYRMAWTVENYYWFSFALLLWLHFTIAFMTIRSILPSTARFGHGSSILIEERQNIYFDKSLTVEDVDESRSGLELYGFHNSPPLDVFVNWSESQLVTVSHKSYKAWPYYLNKGASLNISYRVIPEGRTVRLVVDEGEASHRLLRESEDENSLSWNLIQGSGRIEVNINESSYFFVALANPKMKEVKVELNFNVSAVLYDTKQAYYKCDFRNRECTFDLMFHGGSYAVLTSPAPTQGVSGQEDEWDVSFSYKPRWSSYIISTALVPCFMAIIIQFCKILWCFGVESYLAVNNSSGLLRERIPLLAKKDDDGSRIVSSDESFADDEDEFMVEASNGTRRICIMCIDSPRDSIFIPCRHCISCYQCGIMVGEASGICPICRRKIKKVEQIYNA